MATQQTQVLARGLLSPAVALLLRLDDRPAGDDDLFLVPALQPARPGLRVASPASTTTATSSPTPPSSASLQNTLVLVGSVLAITIVLGVPLALLLDQPVLGPQHRAADGDRAVLRHADGERAGLEEPADASGLGPASPGSRHSVGMQPIDWFTDCAADRHHHDRRLAMAALRHADPAHRAAVARRGAEGGGRDGRRRRLLAPSSTSRCRIWRGRSRWSS